MKRTTVTLLALCATGAIAGCGDPYADGARTPATAAPAASSTPAAPTEVERVARDYAELARTWSPKTLRTQYSRQLAATTGQLHDALRQTGAPTKSEIRSAAAERQSASATAQAAHTDQAAVDRARVTVELRELATAADAVTPWTRSYTVELRRRGGHWLVSAFTAAP